jgi:AcrR family transcriptional regulator
MRSRRQPLVPAEEHLVVVQGRTQFTEHRVAERLGEIHPIDPCPHRRPDLLDVEMLPPQGRQSISFGRKVTERPRGKLRARESPSGCGVVLVPARHRVRHRRDLSVCSRLTTRYCSRVTTASGGPTDAGTRVRSIVLPHAADLFAERGPAATSMRDIAERSGVNAGLIFRHIGTKEAVVASVLDYLAEDLVSARDGGASREVVEARGERSWKVIARALLDGFDVARLQRRFPNIDQLLAAAQDHHDDDYAARVATADALALQLGWRLFGPFLRAATGLDQQKPGHIPDPVTGSISEHLGDPRGLHRE